MGEMAMSEGRSSLDMVLSVVRDIKDDIDRFRQESREDQADLHNRINQVHSRVNDVKDQVSQNRQIYEGLSSRVSSVEQFRDHLVRMGIGAMAIAGAFFVSMWTGLLNAIGIGR
jgi:FixJ family two-component response regulator